LLLANTVLDLRHFVQCSAVIVEGDRSATGGPVFGRNLDWPSVANVHEYTLVIIYRQKGKHTFASITFPGVIGCTSGMNDAGLAVAMLDADSKKDGAPGLNLAGVPTLLLLRRVLEECGSVDDAAKLVRSTERASSLNIALCDQHRGAVLEVTTKTVAERRSEQGIVMCTNHFRSEELRESTSCWRYDELTKVTGDKTHTIADIAARLHAVNQGDMTIQTMIFEPVPLKLHVAFGAGPITNHPMSELELATLFVEDSPSAGK
jgi:predicted choloylglycine hydrolase